MGNNNSVHTFNGVMEYQLWASAEGSNVDILHVTERGGQLIVTYRGEEGPAPPTATA